MRLHRSLPVLATSLASLVLLSGCGLAGTDFHPGLAAQVEDDTITSRHVDELADHYCGAFESLSEQERTGDRLPLRYLTHEIANDLVVRAATEQLAEERGVEPGAQYRREVAQLDSQLPPQLSDEQREAVIEVNSAQSYYRDVLTTIGAEELGDEASADEQYAAGEQVLVDWIEEHDVEVNPKYGLTVGTIGQVDTDLSFATSDTAKDGLQPEPVETYAAGLPDHLVCGV